MTAPAHTQYLLTRAAQSRSYKWSANHSSVSGSPDPPTVKTAATDLNHKEDFQAGPHETKPDNKMAKADKIVETAKLEPLKPPVPFRNPKPCSLPFNRQDTGTMNQMDIQTRHHKPTNNKFAHKFEIKK